MQTKIRAMNRNAFRSGDWATLIGFSKMGLKDRWCYVVQFPDGVVDHWPVSDMAHRYEFWDVE